MARAFRHTGGSPTSRVEVVVAVSPAPSTAYPWLADSVLMLHFGIVAFVVGGLLLVVVGHALGWSWVRDPWFRLAHVLAIAVVVAESWLGITCPLTTLEAWLRPPAGAGTQQSGFIEHWVQRLVFYDAPAWAFGAAYTVFGGLVVAAWWLCPPRRGKT